MKLKIGDDEYPFDLESLLLSEAKMIKRHTGMSIKGFIDGVQEMDPDALQAAIHLVKTRAGVAVDFDDLGDLDAFQVEVLVDDEDEDDEDPTKPNESGTSTSTSSDQSTSSRSPKGGTGTRSKSTG